MSLFNMQDGHSPKKGLPLFSLGFRPFFLLAGVAAVILIIYWLYILFFSGAVPCYGKINWHAHEMIYGFTVAVIAGFLLTAESNWTGIQTLNGKWLAMLALLWLLGRIAPFVDIRGELIAIIDLSFLPLLSLILAVPLFVTKQYKQIIFVGIVLVLFVGNLIFHIGYLVHKPAPEISRLGIEIGWLTVLFLITIMGGRVIPFFIERGTGKINQTKTHLLLEVANFAGLFAWILCYLISPRNFLATILAIIVGILQAWRLRGWYLHSLWKNPMLWVLFIGYSWIPISFFIFSFSNIVGMGHSAALHGFTAGSFGLLIIGMMARVSLGHTGRNIVANKATMTAFLCVALGAVLRVIGSLLQQSVLVIYYSYFIKAAGISWAIGFLLFLFVFAPILSKSRVLP